MPGSAGHSTPNALFLMEFIKNILDIKKPMKRSGAVCAPTFPRLPRVMNHLKVSRGLLDGPGILLNDSWRVATEGKRARYARQY